MPQGSTGCPAASSFQKENISILIFFAKPTFIFQTMRKSFICSLLGVIYVTSIHSLTAEVIFEANFSGSDPMSEENVSLGGFVTPKSSTNGISISQEKPFSSSSGGYLSARIAEDSTARSAVISFTPDSPDNTWGAWITGPDGKKSWQVNGGVDFYFRTDALLGRENILRPIRSQRAHCFWFNIANSALDDRLVLHFGPNVYPADESQDETKKDAVQTPPNKTFAIEPNVVYHIAASFQTDPETGIVTGRLFAKSGEAALSDPIINSSESPDLIGEITFRIKEDKMQPFFKGVQPVPWVLGISESKPGISSGVQDFDRIRIFNLAPEEFSPIQ